MTFQNTEQSSNISVRLVRDKISLFSTENVSNDCLLTSYTRNILGENNLKIFPLHYFSPRWEGRTSKQTVKFLWCELYFFPPAALLSLAGRVVTPLLQTADQLTAVPEQCRFTLHSPPPSAFIDRIAMEEKDWRLHRDVQFDILQELRLSQVLTFQIQNNSLSIQSRRPVLLCWRPSGWGDPRTL